MIRRVLPLILFALTAGVGPGASPCSYMGAGRPPRPPASRRRKWKGWQQQRERGRR